MLFTNMVLIVASILLAFALGSWWQDHQDAEEEIKLLQGLQEEFTRNRETLQYYWDFNQRGIEQPAVLTAAAVGGQWAPGPVTPDKAFEGLVIPPTSDLGSGVLSTLITSGRLAWICYVTGACAGSWLPGTAFTVNWGTMSRFHDSTCSRRSCHC
jgi:hypothetical protein